jgi:ABC-2 type transport system permease protein
MEKFLKVMGHEFRMTAVSKAFIILTILGPFLLIGMTVVPALVSQKSERRGIEIAVTGSPEEIFTAVAEPLAQLGVVLQRSDQPVEVLADRFREEDLYGYLVFPADYLSGGALELVTEEFPDYRIVESMKGVIGQAIMDERIKRAGLDSAQIRELTTPLEIQAKQITRTGAKAQTDTFSFIMIGITFTLMLYMTILMYGQSIGRSVVQEKTSKTVEIMLSSVSERDLLFGKIFGQAAASLLQYTVWIGMVLIGARLIGPGLGLDRLPQLSLSTLLYLVLFFILGFFLYSALFAAFGAAAQDEQNLGQLSWPVIVVLVFPMVSAGPIITAPSSSFSVFLSLFPPTAPIVMFVRILVSDPKGWQILLSVGLQAVTVFIMILLSAKIFRIGILMTGKRFTLAGVLRLLKS